MIELSKYHRVFKIYVVRIIIYDIIQGGIKMYKSTEVKDDIVWIGVNDRKIEKWESHIPLDFGVTYNSYVILDEKICIIDGVEEGENGDFFRKLEATIGDREVDYIIINHVEPDHSG